MREIGNKSQNIYNHMLASKKVKTVIYIYRFTCLYNLTIHALYYEKTVSIVDGYFQEHKVYLRSNLLEICEKTTPTETRDI